MVLYPNLPRIFVCLLIIIGCFCCGILSGHQDAVDDRPSFKALKVDAPLVVDGVLDEPFWAEADVATDFIDRRTQELASQQTVARIAYGRNALYVALEMFDDKIEELHASERREDRFYRGDDFVEVHIEPSHIHRMKYAFFSNPLGTKLDAIEGFSGGSFNTGWSTDWDLAAKVLDDRWVFEMRIPYGAMHYSREDGQTWGINFSRSIPRLDSYSWWSFNPTDSFRPHNFGHGTDFDLADTVFDRNWEISPYVSSRIDFNGETNTDFEGGIDASFRLSPSIITALTLNPDFGQVEADADTIELRDTERFLPERRPFFREGSELFKMPHRLYYTRRFTDIETGAKMSGEYKGLHFAFLNIGGETIHGTTRDGNSSVLRAVQGIGTKSSIGYYLNNSDFEDGHSRVASSDGFFFLNEDFRFSYQATAVDDEIVDDTEAIIKDSTDFLGFGALSYEKYPWELTLGYNAITDEFDPNLGLIFRRNIFGPTFMAAYDHESEKTWYKALEVEFDTQHYRNEDSRTILRDYRLGSHIVFHNDFGVQVSHSRDFHDPYKDHRTRMGISFNTTDYWKTTSLAWAAGEFQGTDYQEAILGKRYQPSTRLPIRWEYVARYEDLPDGTEKTIWLNRLIADYFFTDDMWIKSSFQHQNSDIHNISVIYGWKIKEDLQWYLVYNSVADKLETENSVFTKLVYTFSKRRRNRQ